MNVNILINTERGICEFSGCKCLKRKKGFKNNKVIYGKLCSYHHKIKNKNLNINDVFPFSLKEEIIPNKECELCKWDKGPCDRHRLDNTKGYIRDNVIVLCPNCHRLVTMNIIQINKESGGVSLDPSETPLSPHKMN